MHQAGASALAQLLRYDPPDANHRTLPCPCGRSTSYKELRSKTVLTVLRPVELRRPYYTCADCSKGQYPVDAELYVAGLESSPGVRRMEAVVGSEMPFTPGCEPMKLLAGLEVTAKAIERAAEAIGAEIAQQDEQEIGRAKQLVLPVVSKQNIPKMYILMDGVQVPVDAAEEFGFRIYTEAWRRGWEWATIKVVIGDGVVWIWNLADQRFPVAIQIVDLYHARQHSRKIAALLHPQDPAAKELWMTPMKDLLDDGNIEPLVTHLREIAAAHSNAIIALRCCRINGRFEDYCCRS